MPITKAQQVAEPAPFIAGKNRIINGDFSIWQRGATFSNPNNGSYLADRFNYYFAASPTTWSFSRESFTPGNVIPGYESQYFFRSTPTNANANTIYDISQAIEDVRTFANQTVTFSFWAKASSSSTLNVYYYQSFGTGGSSAAGGPLVPFTLTTSWQRFTYTFIVPTISGKTIGPGSNLLMALRIPATTGTVVDLWGIQLEAGSVATPFVPAGGGAQQAELALCQRYYQRPSNTSAYALYGYGTARSTTQANIFIQFPVPMRIAPTAVDFSTLQITVPGLSGEAVNSLFLDSTSNLGADIICNVSSGLTSNRSYAIGNRNSTSGYLGFSAEF